MTHRKPLGGPRSAAQRRLQSGLSGLRGSSIKNSERKWNRLVGCGCAGAGRTAISPTLALCFGHLRSCAQPGECRGVARRPGAHPSSHRFGFAPAALQLVPTLIPVNLALIRIGFGCSAGTRSDRRKAPRVDLTPQSPTTRRIDGGCSTMKSTRPYATLWSPIRPTPQLDWLLLTTDNTHRQRAENAARRLGRPPNV